MDHQKMTLTPANSNNTPCRRLGLRRSIPKKCVQKEQVKSEEKIQDPQPAAIQTNQIFKPKICKIILKDICKENVKISNSHTSSVATPPPISTPITATSTKCLRTRLGYTSNKKFNLSFSPIVRDKLSKKRLNFLASKSPSFLSVKTELEDKSVQKPNEQIAETAKVSEEPIHLEGSCYQILTVLSKEINEKENKIKLLEKHAAEVLKLQNSIDVWEEGCKQALSLLKERLDEPMDTEDILKHFNISVDLIKF